MNVLSAVLLAVFAVIGVICVVRAVTCLIFRSKKDGGIIFVTPVKGRREDAEYMLRSAAARVKWVSSGRNDLVICLDCGMDAETRTICEGICRDLGFAKLMSKKEFLETL